MPNVPASAQNLKVEPKQTDIAVTSWQPVMKDHDLCADL